MELKDLKHYEKTGEGGCKSQIKDFINLYITILKRVKKESSSELDGVKINIKRRYPQEVYLTIVDENDFPVKFTLTEKTKEYIIPVFSDVCEYSKGSEKIADLFLDELSQKTISSKDIEELGENDANFKGIVINPHSQNFTMDWKGNI